MAIRIGSHSSVVKIPCVSFDDTTAGQSLRRHIVEIYPILPCQLNHYLIKRDEIFFHFLRSVDETRMLVFKSSIARPTTFVDIELDEVKIIVELARENGFM